MAAAATAAAFTGLGLGAGAVCVAEREASPGGDLGVGESRVGLVTELEEETFNEEDSACEAAPNEVIVGDLTPVGLEMVF